MWSDATGYSCKFWSNNLHLVIPIWRFWHNPPLSKDYGLSVSPVCGRPDEWAVVVPVASSRTRGADAAAAAGACAAVQRGQRRIQRRRGVHRRVVITPEISFRQSYEVAWNLKIVYETKTPWLIVWKITFQTSKIDLLTFTRTRTQSKIKLTRQNVVLISSSLIKLMTQMTITKWRISPLSPTV